MYACMYVSMYVCIFKLSNALAYQICYLHISSNNIIINNQVTVTCFFHVGVACLWLS